jgi:NADPH:quinone reductase-like Zn-dependent oxidoreductase
MNAVRIHKFRGGPQDLVYEDVPRPIPKDGEILVKVRATGVTLNEIVWIWDSPEMSVPRILGHELSGFVEEFDPSVPSLKVGEAVYGLTDPSSVTRDGTDAEYVLVTNSEIAPKPRTLTHENAAGVPMPGLTAWQALFDHAHLSSKDTILIHGAAGGLGGLAVQFARWAGAHVIGTASEHNSNLVKNLGVNEVIDYKKIRFEERVHDVDVVFDTVGGETLERSWKVLKKGGRLVSVATEGLPTNYEAYFKENRDSYGVDATWFIVHSSRDQLIRIGELIDSGHIKPMVDTILPLSQASQAYEGAKEIHKYGKIVLHVS